MLTDLKILLQADATVNF